MTTLDDLRRTLGEALGTGKLGTPASVRLSLPWSASELSDGLAAAMPLVSTVFPDQPKTLLARRDADARQLTALLTYPGGQTALITVLRANSADGTPRLLVVGNHGIARLEGECAFDSLSLSPGEGPLWRQRVEHSLRENAAVPLHQ